jgi:hypothetical protein
VKRPHIGPIVADWPRQGKRLHEIKHDGFRIMARRHNRGVPASLGALDEARPCGKRR